MSRDGRWERVRISKIEDNPENHPHHTCTTTTILSNYLSSNLMLLASSSVGSSKSLQIYEGPFYGPS